MVDQKFNVGGRDILRGIGATGSIGAIGIGTVQARTDDESVPEREVAEILRKAVSRAALETAGLDQPDPTEARRVTVSGPGHVTEEWIALPVGDDETFSYNPEKEIAEIERNSNSLVRATAHDGDVIVEDLLLGEAVTEDAIETLESSDEFEQALNNAGVVEVELEDAAANFDRESGTTRAFVPVTNAGGSESTLFVEIAPDDSLEAVYGLPADTSGVGLADSDGIECWIGCLGFGLTCANVCTPCASVPTAPTCAPCAVCVGATAAAACARECDIPEFW
ncbi:hypothetical protein [Haloterrigena gelatinilytica]|uniref:hypothetical protein n=1 Tax=Haloterrigena gelatinilytica TaxID=2741724 RepID=UPI0020C70DF1|nr:hypothetical protein [Haloterrigena gelatinilytica]